MLCQYHKKMKAFIRSVLKTGFIIPYVIGSFANISKAFMFADFGNGIVLLLNVPALILLGKTLRSVTKEWFDHKGDLKAIEEARKNK